MKNKKDGIVSLSEGSGGEEMQNLVESIRKIIGQNYSIKHDSVLDGKLTWENTDNDSATLKIGDKYLVFTTDSFVADPIFFPNGNIGKIAACGTINDISVMGATPLGISLSFVIEEGFPKKDLEKIVASIGNISKETGIPVVTGDTKVMEKGKIDKIIINTSAVGICKSIFDRKIEEGDAVIISGSIAEHGCALMAKRLDFKTKIKSDSKPVISEILSVKMLAKQAKDPTRGGIASALNELSKRNNVGLYIEESKIPVRKDVKAFCDILGLSPYEIACEGRFILIVSKEDVDEALEKLKKFNKSAAVIGYAEKGSGVVIKTDFGERILNNPVGRIIPRIC